MRTQIPHLFSDCDYDYEHRFSDFLSTSTKSLVPKHFLFYQLQFLKNSFFRTPSYFFMEADPGMASSGQPRMPTTFAGTPAAIASDGMDLVTTAPAAMTHPFPRVTPGRITQDAAIQTSSSITPGVYSYHCSRMLRLFDL